MGLPSAGDIASKLFTANEGLIISIEGTLKPEKLIEIREAIIKILNQS